MTEPKFIPATGSAPSTHPVDEEGVRLLTGLNDIFVSLAILLVLTATAWFGTQLTPPLGAASVAMLSWLLAEYFIRRRRMALPSVVLMLGFVGGIVIMTGLILVEIKLWPNQHGRPFAIKSVLVGGAGLLAGLLHWHRFRVAMTVAVAALAGFVTVVSLAFAAWPSLSSHTRILFLIGGLGAFALALRWDGSDPTRSTYRSDVAFWLHLLAAPMIVHPLFQWIGVTSSSLSLSPQAETPLDGVQHHVILQAFLALAVYLALGFVAIVVDRRAGLVAGLFYVVYAVALLLRSTATVDASLALTALLVGGILLLLSVFWRQARYRILTPLPASWRNRLPPT